MKKKYENIQLEIQLFSHQDVITSSVFVEWGDDWSGNQDGNWTDHNFG